MFSVLKCDIFEYVYKCCFFKQQVIPIISVFDLQYSPFTLVNLIQTLQSVWRILPRNKYGDSYTSVASHLNKTFSETSMVMLIQASLVILVNLVQKSLITLVNLAQKSLKPGESFPVTLVNLIKTTLLFLVNHTPTSLDLVVYFIQTSPVTEVNHIQTLLVMPVYLVHHIQMSLVKLVHIILMSLVTPKILHRRH